MGAARERFRQARQTLLDFQPRLEELHLSIRMQDVTLQKFEGYLIGVAQSGWTKLGLALHIPWLSKWHAEAFDTSKGGATPVVRKDDFEVPLSVKEHMREELVRTIDALGYFPA